MIYSALTVGLTKEFLLALKILIIQCDVRFTPSATTQEIRRLIEHQIKIEIGTFTILSRFLSFHSSNASHLAP